MTGLRWWLEPRLATELERHRYRPPLERLAIAFHRTARTLAEALTPVLRAAGQAFADFGRALPTDPRSEQETSQ